MYILVFGEIVLPRMKYSCGRMDCIRKSKMSLKISSHLDPEDIDVNKM